MPVGPWLNFAEYFNNYIFQPKNKYINIKYR